MSNPFTTEAWAEYAVGMIVILLRTTARCWQVGLRWDGDDYFAVLCTFFFTAQLVMLELIGQNGSITGMSNQIASELTSDQGQRIVLGSKYLLAGWILYTTLLWCLKACMLFFYRRLTLNLQQQNLVKVTGAVCVAAYIATIIAFLTHCHPIHRLWQLYPYPGDDCALNISKYLALVVTNITTDLMILYIPLSLLWNVRLPVRRKLSYGCWLCTGIFIMTATLLRCILCLQDVSQINVGTIWSIRETFVGILAVNAPVLKPFFRQATKTMSLIISSRDNSGHHLPDSLRLSHVERKGKRRTVHEIDNIDMIINGSEEHLVSQETNGGRPRSEISSRDESSGV